MTRSLCHCMRAAVVALAIVGSLCWTSPAKADFRIRVEDTALGIGVVLTAVPGSGFVNYTGPVGTFTLTVDTGTSKPILAPYGSMDLTSLTLTSTGADSIRIWLEDTGFVAPAGTMNIGAKIGGTLTDGEINFNAWASGSNGVIALGPDQPVVGPLPGLGFLPGDSMSPWSPPFSATSGAFSGTAGGDQFDTGGVYSLMMQVVVAFDGPGATSFDAEVLTSAVPEPSSMVIAGIGLFSLAGARLRRRKKLVA
jgi:hypothetical protein